MTLVIQRPVGVRKPCAASSEHERRGKGEEEEDPDGRVADAALP